MHWNLLQRCFARPLDVLSWQGLGDTHTSVAHVVPGPARCPRPEADLLAASTPRFATRGSIGLRVHMHIHACAAYMHALLYGQPRASGGAHVRPRGRSHSGRQQSCTGSSTAPSRARWLKQLTRTHAAARRVARPLTRGMRLIHGTCFVHGMQWAPGLMPSQNSMVAPAAAYTACYLWLWSRLTMPCHFRPYPARPGAPAEASAPESGHHRRVNVETSGDVRGRQGTAAHVRPPRYSRTSITPCILPGLRSPRTRGPHVLTPLALYACIRMQLQRRGAGYLLESS